jgi:hypothetical protein
MSQLRDQLQSLKRDYASARYPGNLADELLKPARSPMRIVAWTTLATGIAAAILISLLHTPTMTPKPPIQPTVIATTLNAEDLHETAVAVSEMSSLPSFPDDIPLAPTAEAMDIGSMPSFPSLDLNFEGEIENASTTKESV